MSSLKHLKIAICNDYCLSMFCPQCLHLYSKRFILSYFAPQKLGRQLGFFRPPCRRQEIDIAQLTLVLAEALHLDQTLFNQNLEAEIDRTKLRLRILSLRTLTDLESLMQTAQNFELNFLLKTSHFLEGNTRLKVTQARYRPAVSRSASAVSGFGSKSVAIECGKRTDASSTDERIVPHHRDFRDPLI
ncbi:hypothetical protein [Laribacter hongkongensis]|uniref:hypothetical protein n=1 Tax=Laribacter hongkongensis TaxID=168471 RepID=UPI001EFDF88D|nr:hypothetical protein [Laribacter hongkongensis]